MSWLDFEARLTKAPPVIANEADRPAFGPHQLRGMRRSNDDVLSLCMMAFDFDGISPDQFTALVAKVERFQGLIYSTYNYGPKGIAIRLILPHQELSPARWKKDRIRTLNWLGVPDDEKTHDLARIFFIPCSRPGAPSPAFIRLKGRPFDPSLLPGEQIITINDWDALRRNLAKKKKNCGNEEQRIRLRPLVQAIDNILIGQPYAPQGERDQTMFGLACEMLKFWGQDIDTESIIQVMDRSLNLMDPDCRHDHAREKLERVFSKARTEQLDATEERVRQHFKRLGRIRSEPYTHEEMIFMRNSFADQDHLGYLVEAHGYIYGLTIEGYKPFGRAELPDIVKALSPFPNVEFRDASGSVKPPKKILEEHGQQAAIVEYSYLHERSTFDGKTFIIATAPRKEIAPLYDPEMDHWIDLMAGNQRGVFREWLSWVPHLTQPLAALFLHGQPGTGKSLFVLALSRLWGGYTNMSSALQRDEGFNATMLDSPLCWADEKFPQHHDGTYKTEELRDLIQAFYHKINQKYRPVMNLRGHVRCVMTANNPNMFRLGKNVLTREDFEAISARILRIDLPGECARFLKITDTKSIAETDRFAAHLLTFPKPVATHRFGITPQPLDYSFVINQFLPGIVCGLIFRLLEGQSLPPGVMMWEGLLHILPGLFAFPQDIKVTSASQKRDAISAISLERKYIHRGLKPGWYYAIDTDALIKFAENTGHTVDWILERLEFHGRSNRVLPG